MKKLPLIVAGFCGFMVSGLAMAAYPQLAAGNNDVTMQNCGLLVNDIKLILSNNVVGGVACNTTTSVAAISVCHSSGQTASRTAVVTKDLTGKTICTPVTGGETCVKTVTGSSYPTASTAQGTVSSLFPGKACKDTDATDVAGTQAPTPAP